MLLDKCQESRISDYLLASNMVNGIKQSWNLNEATFTIFHDHCEDN